MLEKYTVKEILRQMVEGSIHESNGNFNFRCILCGDSKKSKSKRRGWVLFDNEKVTYHCFNCNDSMSFKKLLKDRYPHLYNQYIKQKDVRAILQLGKKDATPTPTKVTKTARIDITDDFMAYTFGIYDRNLDKGKMMLQYTALKFALNRDLPKDFIKQLRVCYDGKFRDRVLIPFYDDEGEIYCFQGRSLTGREPKYLTNKPEGNTKIFNFYNVDPKHLVYILEGPIDALFVDNAIATSGIANYGTEQYEEIAQKFSNRTWVFDNDNTGLDMAIRYAQKGEYVFCWRKEDADVKDINELVLKKGLTKKELCVIINENTATNFKAQIQLKMMLKKEIHSKWEGES